MKNKFKDTDITYYDELSYVYITLRETINILGLHITNATLSKFKRFTL